jgi:ribosomal protein S26
VAHSPRAQSGLEFSDGFSLNWRFPSIKGDGIVARKTVLVCDNCGKEIDEGKGATMRINYSDARRGSKQADLCDNCAGGMPGHAAARRGRRPKAVAA